MPITSKRAVSKGKVITDAAILGLTRNLMGFISMVSRASICSDIRIMPISAAMEEPALPIIIRAVSTGPSSLMRDRATAAPSIPSEPNFTRV